MTERDRKYVDIFGDGRKPDHTSGARPRQSSERSLRVTLRCFCVLPLATGLADVLTGVAPLVAAGARIAPTTAADPTLASQIGFWGAIWFGYGVGLWWAAGDVCGRAVAVRIAVAVLFLSGLAQALAWARFGAPAVPLVGAAVLELVGSPLVWAWHRRVVRTAGEAA